MKKLPESVKRRIVEHLACFWGHAEVADLIDDEFGLRVTPRHVRAYDPTSSQCVASPRLLELHAAARKRFELEVADIAIAHRSFRLKRLQRMFEEAETQGNIPLAAEVLEQAAKEVGGMFEKARVAPARIR